MRRSSRAFGAVLMLVFAAAPVASVAQEPRKASDAVLYRLFLRDGGMLVSYGEFAQVADRVVLSIPIGGTDEQPVLHLLTIPQSDVDWEQTNAYTYAARVRRYVATRAESDFATLSREVANRLNQIVFVDDAAKRLALAEAARRQLVEWPAQHYGYRAYDVSQMATWLDQVVSELRIAAGQSSFDLSLVAMTIPTVPEVQLLPPPSLRERVEIGLHAARRTSNTAERVSLLRAVLEGLPKERPEGSWMAFVHARATAELAAEMKTNRAYAGLTNSTLERAEAYVRRANVRGVESLVQSVLREDSRLKHARPAEVAALLATLDARIDAARRLRLARDAWIVRSRLLREYWATIRQGLDHLLGIRTWLTDIRQLAGPSPRSVERLADVAAQAGRELAEIQPPAEAAGAHATLLTVSSLAKRAAATRLEAIRSENMDVAWQASSAAAGSLMLLDKAVDELRRITTEPRPW
ncbi:MAG: hypothetical protein ACRD15_14075 [Vicinamibacterales bacterium]